MGNQPSRSTTPTSNPQSPNVTQSHAPLHHGTSHAARELNPRRRESIHSLSIKASAAPPSASLESARPQTITPTAVPLSKHIHRSAHDTLKSASDEKMGNEQSRHKSQPREQQQQQQQLQQQQQQQQQQTPPPKLKPQAPEKPSPSPQSKPVDVPAQPREESQGSRTENASSIDPADASQEYFISTPQYTRPPRLPLPIEEEVHTPGSPIISPADIGPVEIGDVDGVLPRRVSVLSSTTAEEDDLPDEFQHQNVPTVPTVVEWDGPGERVYVTGTFAGWNRKYRLHRNGPSKNKHVLSATVNIAPGTHHLKFIVDGDMKTSDTLPTAVDYTNILVNYLEVSLDDVPQPAPGATDENKKPEPAPVQEYRAPPGIYPPQTLPPTPELVPVEQPPPEPPKPKIVPTASAPKKYHSTIPRYLLDLDSPEESQRFARANAAASNLPTPPTLPMFLSKSILNGTTPMKDDSSVLIMPNHTVLNHLATSSIKDNILATSATTRYKQKFLTTIMYKPKSEDPEREHS